MSWELHLDNLVLAVGGEVLSTYRSEFCGVGTDTRGDLKGKIFFALKGERFDAHDYLMDAVKAGAAALVIHRDAPDIERLVSQVTILRVDDTLLALQQLALYWRRKHRLRIVGITGSNGKTTTKEFTQEILSTRFRVHANQGSFNNHWGVPLTLLSADPDTEIVISEMGMNHPGELTELVEIAKPDIVVCTTVGRAHLEFFKSIEDVAVAKEEIYLKVPHTTYKIFNLDNVHTYKMYEKAVKELNRLKTKIIIPPYISFAGLRRDVDVFFCIDRVEIEGIKISGEIRKVKGTATVPVFGIQNVNNLMAAASIALACGMKPQDIWDALGRCKTSWGRNQLIEQIDAPTILFDGYNANPDSMKALMENIKNITIPQKRIDRIKKVALLGEMLEMGAEREVVHQELAEQVVAAGVDLVWFIGKSHQSFIKGLEKMKFHGWWRATEDYDQAVAQEIKSLVKRDDYVFIKGSRGMKLERTLDIWQIALPKK